MWGSGESPTRVLIVDDNVDTAESLALLLEVCGHEVRAVHAGADAVRAAGEFRPDAVLLDIGLPDVDGFEVARRLRAAPGFRDVLLVAATGYNRPRDRDRAAEVGFDCYLVKPFDPTRLSHLLAARRPVAAA